jgi:hypothetical protein
LGPVIRRTFPKEEDMSEERLQQDESQGKTEDDVEAHQKKAMANEEPTADDESDDVEAHARRAQHRAL